MKLDHFLIPYIKINSIWIKNLNMTPATIKLLDQNIGSDFSDISHSKIFLDMSPQARETKPKINYWGYVKIKKFLPSKGKKNPVKQKGNLLNWRRYFQ